MTDEHLMRLWADAHSDFTTDFLRGLQRLRAFVSGKMQRRRANSTAYPSASRRATRSDDRMSATGRAALAGLTACLATMALLATVALLATAGMGSAAAHPLMTHVPIMTHVMVA